MASWHQWAAVLSGIIESIGFLHQYDEFFVCLRSFIHWMSRFPSGYFIYKQFLDWIYRIITISQYTVYRYLTKQSQCEIHLVAAGECLIISRNLSQQMEFARLSLNCRCSNLHFQSISRTSRLRLIVQIDIAVKITYTVIEDFILICSCFMYFEQSAYFLYQIDKK